MERTRFSVLHVLLFYLFTDLNPVQSRKYDLEAESLKLFGEKLRNVIWRFRKTPEYMAILSDKVNQLRDELDDMMQQVVSAFKVKLDKHINTTMRASTKPEQNPNFRVKSETEFLPSILRRQLRQQYPDPVKEENITTLSPVEKLDANPSLNSSLTVPEKNLYRELGFEFAGNAIHHIILSMGEPPEETPESTRMPADDHETTLTTKHVAVHEVTTMATEETPLPPIQDETSTVKGFHYRAVKDRKKDHIEDHPKKVTPGKPREYHVPKIRDLEHDTTPLGSFDKGPRSVGLNDMSPFDINSHDAAPNDLGPHDKDPQEKGPSEKKQKSIEKTLAVNLNLDSLFNK